MRYKIKKTRWGYVGAIALDGSLIRTFLPAEKRVTMRAITDAMPHATQAAERDVSARFCNQVIDYLVGKPIAFSVLPFHFSGGTDLERAIWTAVSEIPSGRIATYGDIAEKTGNRLRARAVGRALSKNPLPMVIPCHRIIAADKTMGGFTADGGIDLKQRLLAIEGITL